MFSIDDLNIITRALTAYENDIKEVIDLAKGLDGSELFVADFKQRLKEIKDVEAKAMDIKWNMLTGKEK